MATYNELEQRIKELKSRTGKGSISPRETFDLMDELLSKTKGVDMTAQPLVVVKSYDTLALANADRNPINPATNKPLALGQLISITTDGTNNAVYRLASLGSDGSPTWEKQAELGDMTNYAKQTDLVQLAGETIPIKDIGNMNFDSIIPLDSDSWESGYWGIDGMPAAGANYIRLKNPIYLVNNSVYELGSLDASHVTIRLLDATNMVVRSLFKAGNTTGVKTINVLEEVKCLIHFSLYPVAAINITQALITKPFLRMKKITESTQNTELVPLDDSLFESGYWDANGNPVAGSSYIRSIRPLAIKPDSYYRLGSNNTGVIALRLLDSSGNVIETQSKVANASMPIEFKTPGNAVKFHIHTGKYPITAITPSYISESGVYLKKTDFIEKTDNARLITTSEAAKLNLLEKGAHFGGITLADSLSPHPGGEGYSAFSSGAMIDGKEVYVVRNATHHETFMSTVSRIVAYTRDSKGEFTTKVLALDYAKGDHRDPNITTSKNGKYLILSVFVAYLEAQGMPVVRTAWTYLLDKNLNVVGTPVQMGGDNTIGWGNTLQTPNGKLIRAAYFKGATTQEAGVKIFRSTGDIENIGSFNELLILYAVSADHPGETTLSYWGNKLVAITRKGVGHGVAAWTADLEGSTGWQTTPLPWIVNAPCLEPYIAKNEPLILSISSYEDGEVMTEKRRPAFSGTADLINWSEKTYLSPYNGSGGYTTFLKNRYGYGLMSYSDNKDVYPATTWLYFYDVDIERYVPIRQLIYEMNKN